MMLLIVLVRLFLLILVCFGLFCGLHVVLV